MSKLHNIKTKQVKIVVSIEDYDFFQINTVIDNNLIDSLITEVGDKIIDRDQCMYFFNQLIFKIDEEKK